MARRKARGKRAGLRRGELSEAEVTAYGPQQPGEGFSIRTSGRGSGRPARSVFSVGYAPELGREAEVAIDPREPAPQQLLAFNRANAEVLGTPGANMVQGGWHEGTSPKVEPFFSVDPAGVARSRIKITPSRDEMIGVEAGILADELGLPKD